MKTILIGTKQIFVDDEDYPLIIQHNWTLGGGAKTKYPRTNIKIRRGIFRTVSMHSFILNAQGRAVDHIDRNPFNNCKLNLRFASKSQNAFNRPPLKKKFKGVRFNFEIKKFQARIEVQGVNFDLGYFAFENEAAYAYNVAADSLIGEFAWKNPVLFLPNAAEIKANTLQQIQIRKTHINYGHSTRTTP